MPLCHCVALKAKLPHHVSNVNMSVVLIEQQLFSQWNTINMWDILVPLYGSYGRQHAMLYSLLPKAYTAIQDCWTV